MTRIVNIALTKNCRGAIICYALCAVCLATTLNSCQSPPQVANTATSLDINSCHTAHILSPGASVLQMNLTYSPALTSVTSIQGSDFQKNYAYTGGIMFETGVAENFQAGVGGQFGISPKIEDTGLNGSVGVNHYIKIAVSESSERGNATVRTAIVGDFSYQVGDQSEARHIISFDSSRPTLGFFWYGGGLEPDSSLQWNVGSRSLRGTLAFPITLQIPASALSFTIRPALHYFGYTLFGREIIQRATTDFYKENEILLHRDYLVPSLSFGYSLQETTLNVEQFSFELTLALWDSNVALSGGATFRIPLHIVDSQIIERLSGE